MDTAARHHRKRCAKLGTPGMYFAVGTAVLQLHEKKKKNRQKRSLGAKSVVSLRRWR
jgi:hypothetical protein